MDVKRGGKSNFSIQFCFMLCFFFLFQIGGYAQTCVCSGFTCNPCGGNIKKLKLKYVGSQSALILVTDNPNTAFFEILDPNEVFTINGTLSSGIFATNEVKFFVAGIFNTRINVTCALLFYPGITYGDFVILEAESNVGGKLCCTIQPPDTTAPVITDCPSQIEVSASTCGAQVVWNDPTATDCYLASFTSNYSSGAQFPIGTTTVLYTAKDKSNNSSQCSFKVIVKDQTPPEILDCPTSMTISADASCKGKAIWIAPTATDNCGNVTLTSSHSSGSLFPIGTTTVTYTAKDAKGNTSTCTFDVMVKDETPPEISNCPASITISADAFCKGKATWTSPIIEDYCGSVEIGSSHNSGDEFPLGTTTVTYTAKDKVGNISTCQFDVIVEDKISPVINCPTDINLATLDSRGVTVSWDAVEVDDCNLQNNSSSHHSGDHFPVGVTEVKYTATDNSGNVTNCSFHINIELTKVTLDISKIITPDNNGVNDVWMIGNIERYEENSVVIVDRWGSVVFSANNYNNETTVWNGSNKNGTAVPTGTYFYTISIPAGSSVSEKKGFIELIR
jgi:gliding motility-associated-like protein